jgi:flagellar hook-associated protein 3 FlgL
MPLIDRISTPSQHLQSMDSLAAAQNRMAQLQEQVSSGKAFQRASEDPNGAQSAMKLRAEQTRMAQFANNIDTGLLRLNAARIQIDSVNDQLLRVRDIVTQGQQTNGLMTASVRSALAEEIDVLKSSLLIAANADFAGRQLFAGASGVTAAYDASGNYRGDTNTITARVDPDSVVRTQVNGTEVFGTGAANAFAVLTGIAANLRSNTPANLAANLVSLDAVMDTAREAQATVGSRINQLNELKDLTSDKEVSLAGALSAVEDTDLSKAIMELTLQQTGYEAALHATASVMQPSLMDFLR